MPGQDHAGPCNREIAGVRLSSHIHALLQVYKSAAQPALPLTLTCVTVLLSHQAALKTFDDDHNGSLDHDEFERFAKSLMKSGGWGVEAGAGSTHSNQQDVVAAELGSIHVIGGCRAAAAPGRRKNALHGCSWLKQAEAMQSSLTYGIGCARACIADPIQVKAEGGAASCVVSWPPATCTAVGAWHQSNDITLLTYLFTGLPLSHPLLLCAVVQALICSLLAWARMQC